MGIQWGKTLTELATGAVDIVTFDPLTKLFLKTAIGMFTDVLKGQDRTQETLSRIEHAQSQIQRNQDRQDHAYYEIGLSALQSAQLARTAAKRTALLNEADEHFRHAASLEMGVIKAMAWFATGVCNDLQKEPAIAVQCYTTGCRVAEMDEDYAFLVRETRAFLGKRGFALTPEPGAQQLSMAEYFGFGPAFSGIVPTVTLQEIKHRYDRSKNAVLLMEIVSRRLQAHHASTPTDAYLAKDIIAVGDWVSQNQPLW